ncbi:hypothetical protein GA0070216_11189 [Micromonospora matsumotoense]|uniref:Uncharacterized protein n=1 Tax=Micromonospora matsumotoense TaxID=121616 RepID=A0A1C4ZTM8_9ACTN|nr:hypothetical protein GA0070216_11189 [Micromonospora matsumotoense]
MTAPEVRSGEVLHLSRAASVQFIRPITVRVIRVLTDWHTYDGWVWIDAYQLNAVGDAVRRRTLFVMPAGARRLTPQPGPTTPDARPAAPQRRATIPRPATADAQRRTTPPRPGMMSPQPDRQGGATTSRRAATVPQGARPGRGRERRSAGTP